jgi:predicted 2-oxoglutarate/Fe(II)-dependent dioxygenase YbiX
MRQVDGRTVLVVDYGHKRRMDHVVTDEAVRERLWQRFERRVFPEIKKAYQFDVTRMERFLVACYEAEQRGHFQPHRDNTTAGTAHRRFAVTLNLNADFVGGELHFPEFGPRRYRPPIGAALVFSCSLLHAVDAVTQGRRFAFLPFLYDESAARLREKNNAFLSAEVAPYRYTSRDGEGEIATAPGNPPTTSSP